MKKGKSVKPNLGDEWLNLITGTLYKWDGKVWRSTGKTPYGPDPMGLIQDGTIRYDGNSE
jgi:hypothetical protein